MIRYCRFLPVLFCVSFAFAQSAAEINVGFGTAHDKASSTGYDSGTGLSCTTGSTCVRTPALSGFFMGFGGTIMLSKHAGFGGEASLQPAKGPAAIDRYVYITLHETFVDYLIVKYSEMEKVKTVGQLAHPLIRAALELTEVPAPGLEIASMSDIPENQLILGMLDKINSE